MEYKIETPIMLWQGYNPTALPLNITILNMESVDNILIKEVVFTVDSVEDGNIRAYAKMFLQKGKEKAPTFLYIPTGTEKLEFGPFTKAVFERGYNVAVIDFGGEAEGKDHYTTYPESLKYCNLDANKELLYKACPARRSPWFTWIKVIRRAITLLVEEPAVDSDNLIVIGYIEGAQLAWSVAGIDGRVRAVIPVGADGYVEYTNIPKYLPSGGLQISDEMECWLAGISAQAYAKMVMCPVMYMAGTNSTFADIDRLSDLFALIPSKKKYMLFSSNTNHNITLTNFESGLTWLERILAEPSEEIVSPELKTYVSEGKLYASVKGIKGSVKINIYYALDERYPAFRNWLLTSTPIKAGDDESIAQIPVFADSEMVFAYATVSFENGIMLSTHEVVAELSQLKLTEFDIENKVKRGRLIFNGSMPKTFFSVETLYPVVDESSLQIAKGPYDIKGIGVTQGKLCTYNIVPPDDRNDGDFILQMDIYSSKERIIKINLYTAENGGTKYSYYITLQASPSWQRINLSKGDFKTKEMLPLKDWAMVRKMKILKAEGVLFNNILWV